MQEGIFFKTSLLVLRSFFFFNVNAVFEESGELTRSEINNCGACFIPVRENNTRFFDSAERFNSQADFKSLDSVEREASVQEILTSELSVVVIRIENSVVPVVNKPSEVAFSLLFLSYFSLKLSAFFVCLKVRVKIWHEKSDSLLNIAAEFNISHELSNVAALFEFPVIKAVSVLINSKSVLAAAVGSDRISPVSRAALPEPEIEHLFCHCYDIELLLNYLENTLF